MAMTMDVIKNLVKEVPMYVIVADDDTLVHGHDSVNVDERHDEVVGRAL